MAETMAGLGVLKRGALFLGALACAGILCALFAAAQAGAAWSPPTTIANTHGAGFTQVAMDSAGDSVFAWRQGGVDGTEIDTRARMSNGTLSPVQRIARPGDVASDADFDVDPAGNAYYVWQSTDLQSTTNAFQIRARVRSAGGTLGPIVTLAKVKSGDFLGDPVVAAGANGRAVFMWIRGDFHDHPDVIHARKLSASGQLGPVRTVARASFAEQQMAVDGSGNATFVWEQRKDGRPALLTRTLTSGGGLTTPERVSQAGHAAGNPRVGMTPDGRTVFEWQDNAAGTSDQVLMARGRSADGTMQAPQVLANEGSANVSFAVSPNGASVTCWTSGAHGGLRARSRTFGGTLSPMLAVTPSYDSLCAPGTDSDGNLVLAWTASDGNKDRVYARSGPAGGRLGPARALSPAGFHANFVDVAIATGPTVPVVWTAGKRGFAVQGAFGP